MKNRKIKKVVITGISGSGGSYLAEYILNNHPDVELHGITRWHSTTTNKNLKNIMQKVLIHDCDLTDLSSVFRIQQIIKPDAIFHTASYANVLASFNTPIAVLNNNIIGTVNLFEAGKLSKIDSIVQLCSTSEVYGQVDPKNVPIKENCPLNPSSTYAVSQVTQDLMGYTYFKNWNMKVIRTRMFAYINPRRSDLFATAFAMQVARIEAGLQKVLLHGNLDSVRTIIDVRDAMESYWIALKKCEFGEIYNIGGTTVMKVGDFLNVLKKMARCKIPSKPEPGLFRPTDVTLQIPDTSKFMKQTGWKPKYTFEQSIQILLDHCRNEVKKELSK